MKDLEFYRAAEEWPQPPDDPCTLADISAETEIKPKEKKSNRRVRKKMSESLAGVTAAAVAAVVMMNTISPKDFFKEDFLGNSPIVDVQNEVCPICSTKGCPYYDTDDQMEGLTITFKQEPERGVYDLYAMNGFVGSEYNNIYETYEAITTETGQRLILKVEGGVFTRGHGNTTWRLITYNTENQRGDTLAFSGGGVEFTEEKSGDTYEVYVYLAYAADGNLDPDRIDEAYDGRVDWTGMAFRSFPVDGVANAQIHVYSNMGQEYMETIWDACQVMVLPEKNVRYPLGQTMYFQENGDICRRFCDLDHGWTGHFIRTYEGSEEWKFNAHFDTKTYSIDYETITFAAVSWLDVFDQWQQLNIAAPSYGHSVCFPIYELGETVVNGIAYRCYAVYADTGAEFMWGEYLCVPLQEPNILLSVHARISEEVKTALQSGMMDANNALEEMAMVQWITLR